MEQVQNAVVDLRPDPCAMLGSGFTKLIHTVISPPFGLINPYPISTQGAAPILRDLSLLPVLDWYLLGLQLEVSDYELSIIQRNYPRDNRMCEVMMFEAWLRVDTSASYEKLARALVTVGRRNIAEEMCTARGMCVL